MVSGLRGGGEALRTRGKVIAMARAPRGSGWNAGENGAIVSRKRSGLGCRDEHGNLAVELARFRGRMKQVAAVVNGRSSAAIVDAWLNVDRAVHSLGLAMQDAAESEGWGHVEYLACLESLSSDVPVVSGKRMTLGDHMWLGATLHRLRANPMGWAATLFPLYPKHHDACRRVKKVVDAVDSLRSKLDDLLARKFPAEFDPRVYYPGPGGSGPAAAVTTTTADLLHG